MSKKEKEAKEEKQPQEKAEKTSKASEKKDEKKESETDMLKKQLEEANDKFLRLNAEYQNFKRRSEKEKQETYSFAKVGHVPYFSCKALPMSSAPSSFTASAKRIVSLVSGSART